MHALLSAEAFKMKKKKNDEMCHDVAYPRHVASLAEQSLSLSVQMHPDAQ